MRTIEKNLKNREMGRDAEKEAFSSSASPHAALKGRVQSGAIAIFGK